MKKWIRPIFGFPLPHGRTAPSYVENRFRIRGSLTFTKLLEFLPAMIATNISTLLLVTVDGLVAGNLVGENALSSISFFGPIETLIGAITAIFSTGASTVLSLRIGDADPEGIMRAKKAVKLVTVMSAIAVSIIQIPLVLGIIYSYELSPVMMPLVVSYAIGLMIATPFGLIATIGTYQLQIMGKMKVLMYLSIMEGVLNLVLDILFTGVFHMGVAGTGYGTAIACAIRCAATVIYLYRKTDIFKSGDAKAGFRDFMEIISKGLPDASYLLVVALQNYAIIRILFTYLGDSCGSIKAVCTFCYSLTNVLMSSVQGSMRPLMGLMSGAENRRGIRRLMFQGIVLIVGLSGILVVLMEAWPGFFYRLHGVTDIPQAGEASLRFYALCITFLGINTVFRMYFTNRGVQRFSTILTLVGNSTMPLFALLLGRYFQPQTIWLSYCFSALLILAVNLAVYGIQVYRDNNTVKDHIRRVYLSVDPGDALEASRMIKNYLTEEGCSLRLANRARLCMEEMVNYSVRASGHHSVENQIMISFSGEEVDFMMLDNGECIVFDEDREKQRMITDNYTLLKRIAKSVQYQYVLNLNHTIVKFA